MDPPKTRRELKKDPRTKKGDGPYSKKHVRITEALREKRAGSSSGRGAS